VNAKKLNAITGMLNINSLGEKNACTIEKASMMGMKKASKRLSTYENSIFISFLNNS
jgi:hypothetical protein